MSADQIIDEMTKNSKCKSRTFTAELSMGMQYSNKPSYKCYFLHFARTGLEADFRVRDRLVRGICYDKRTFVLSPPSKEELDATKRRTAAITKGNVKPKSWVTVSAAGRQGAKVQLTHSAALTWDELQVVADTYGVDVEILKGETTQLGTVDVTVLSIPRRRIMTCTLPVAFDLKPALVVPAQQPATKANGARPQPASAMWDMVNAKYPGGIVVVEDGQLVAYHEGKVVARLAST